MGAYQPYTSDLQAENIMLTELQEYAHQHVQVCKTAVRAAYKGGGGGALGFPPSSFEFPPPPPPPPPELGQSPT